MKQTLPENSASRDLVWRSRREDIHDAVQVLDAGELNADTPLAGTKRNLDISIEAVRQRRRQVVQSLVARSRPRDVVLGRRGGALLQGHGFFGRSDRHAF